MALRKTSAVKVVEAPPEDGEEIIRERLRTLLRLAISIGTREGLLGNNGNFKIQGGEHVTDKRSQ